MPHKVAGLARSASQKSRDATKAANRAVIKELSTFQPELQDEYRFLLGAVHAIVLGSTATALFATGRIIPMAKTEDGVEVGIIWSKGCEKGQRHCWSGQETDKGLLIAVHVLGLVTYFIGLGLVLAARDTLVLSRSYRIFSGCACMVALLQLASDVKLLGSVGFSAAQGGIALSAAPAVIELLCSFSMFVAGFQGGRRRLRNDGMRTAREDEVGVRRAFEIELYGLGDTDVISKLRSAEERNISLNRNSSLNRSFHALIKRPRVSSKPALPSPPKIPSKALPKGPPDHSHTPQHASLVRFNSTPAVIGTPRYQARPEAARSQSVPLHLQRDPTPAEAGHQAVPSFSGLQRQSTVLYRPAADLQPLPSGPRYSALYQQLSNLPRVSFAQSSPGTATHNMIQDMLASVRDTPPTPLRHAGIARSGYQHTGESSGVSRAFCAASRGPDSSTTHSLLPGDSQQSGHIALQRSSTQSSQDRQSDDPTDVGPSPPPKGSVTPPLRLKSTSRRTSSRSSSLERSARNSFAGTSNPPLVKAPPCELPTSSSSKRQFGSTTSDQETASFDQLEVTGEDELEVLGSPALRLERQQADLAPSSSSSSVRTTSTENHRANDSTQSSEIVLLDAMASPDLGRDLAIGAGSGQRRNDLPLTNMMHFDDMQREHRGTAEPVNSGPASSQQKSRTPTTEQKQSMKLNVEQLQKKLEQLGRRRVSDGPETDENELLMASLSVIGNPAFPTSQDSTLDAEELASKLAVIADIQQQVEDGDAT